ncbi:MAG: condensation domain-containing protein, partial [Bacteroidota bacterium]
MVPNKVVELSAMPLTRNGKIDRNALPDPIYQNEGEENYVVAQDEVQAQFVAIWKELLQVNRIGIHDNFFEMGGDSIITIQLVRRLKKKGFHLLPKDVFDYPTIAELAKIASQTAQHIIAEQGVLNGAVDLLPIQQWFLEKDYANRNYFNQAVLLQVDANLESDTLEKGVQALMEQHDVLRLTFTKEEANWTQCYGTASNELIVEDLTKVDARERAVAITAICEKYQADLDLEKGDLVRAVLIKTGEAKNRLLLAIHHLAVDGVSWRILIDHLGMAIAALQAEEAIDWGTKTSSYRDWSNYLKTYANSASVNRQLSYWTSIVSNPQTLPVDHVVTSDTSKVLKEHRVVLDAQQTGRLLKEVNQAYSTQIEDVLLSSLAQTLCRWSDYDHLPIALESHGRENLSAALDLSNTVGWFTSWYPVNLAFDAHLPIEQLIPTIKEQLRQVPGNGLGYGLLRYLHPSDAVRQQLEGPDQPVVFNYLGQLDNSFEKKAWCQMAPESVGALKGADYPFDHQMEINASILDGQLQLVWTYVAQQYDAQTIEQLAQQYLHQLSNLIDHCASQTTTQLTPSDLGLAPKVDYAELNTFFNSMHNGQTRREQISTLYPLSPMQEGILFHGLYDRQSTAFTQQFRFDLPAGVEVDALKMAWNFLLGNHSILRTSFLFDQLSIPVQCVNRGVVFPFAELDYRDLAGSAQETALQTFLQEDFDRGFQFEEAP